MCPHTQVRALKRMSIKASCTSSLRPHTLVVVKRLLLKLSRYRCERCSACRRRPTTSNSHIQAGPRASRSQVLSSLALLVQKYRYCLKRRSLSQALNQFACFTDTKVQILTQKTLSVPGKGQDGEWRHDRGPPYVKRITMFAGPGWLVQKYKY